MSKSYKPYVNDIGTIILLNTGYDLTTATVFKVYVEKPHGAVEVWTATKHTDNKSIKFVTTGSGINGYQELGLNIIGTDESGLSANTLYNIMINGINYSFTTNSTTTYSGIISSLNSILAPIGINASIVSGDIRIIHLVNSYNKTITLSRSTFNCVFASLTGFVDFNTPVAPVVSSFDRDGVYNLQAYVESPTFKGRGSTVELEVFGDFK